MKEAFIVVSIVVSLVVFSLFVVMNGYGHYKGKGPKPGFYHSWNGWTWDN